MQASTATRRLRFDRQISQIEVLHKFFGWLSAVRRRLTMDGLACSFLRIAAEFSAAASACWLSIQFNRYNRPVNVDDTIVAIATPTGRGGIGVVRLAGPRAVEIAKPMLKLEHGYGAGTRRLRGTRRT